MGASKPISVTRLVLVQPILLTLIQDFFKRCICKFYASSSSLIFQNPTWPVYVTHKTDEVNSRSQRQDIPYFPSTFSVSTQIRPGGVSTDFSNSATTSKNELMSRKMPKKQKSIGDTRNRTGIGTENRVFHNQRNLLRNPSTEALKPQRYVLPLHHVTVLQFELNLTAR